MPFPPTLGTQSISARLQTAAEQLRGRIVRHSHELTHGQVRDIARHLRGDVAPLILIDLRKSCVGAETAALRESAVLVEAAATGLAALATTAGSIWRILAPLASGEASPAALEGAARAARAGFFDQIAVLRQQVAGQSVFGGTASDRPPLSDPEAIWTDLLAVVAGSADAAEVVARVDAFFSLPTGTMATIHASAGAPRSVGAATGPESLPTALDPAIVATLRSAALAALAAAEAALPDLSVRRQILTQGAEAHPASAEALASLRGRVGTVEAAIAEGLGRLAREDEALDLARSGLIGADPYLAASRLEDARQRLETVHLLTARLARLNLMEFLR